jgi:hypothetical protein
MAQYGDSEWLSRSLERRSVRDEVRSAFWAEAGVEPHQAVAEIEYAPETMLLPLVRLLQITRDGLSDADHKAFLPTIAKTLAATGLGKGAMGSVSENIEDLNKFYTRVLEHFFTHPYKFEGPRDGNFEFD